MSLNFSQIRLLILELCALELIKNSPCGYTLKQEDLLKQEGQSGSSLICSIVRMMN